MGVLLKNKKKLIENALCGLNLAILATICRCNKPVKHSCLGSCTVYYCIFNHYKWPGIFALFMIIFANEMLYDLFMLSVTLHILYLDVNTALK